MREVKRKNKFVIISHGRTGSTALMNWLNNLDTVRCHGEVFIRNNYYDADGFRYFCNQSVLSKFSYNTFLNPRYARYNVNIVQDHLISRYLDSLISNKNHSGQWMSLKDRGCFIENHKFEIEKGVGFKLGYGALRGYAGVRKWVKNNGSKIIYLTRKNRVKKILSWEVASKTGLFHSKKETNFNTLISVDLGDFLARLYTDKELSNLIGKIINKLSKPILTISYEDLFINDPKKVCDEVNSFLELDENMFDKSDLSYTKKVNHENIEKIVINYSELYEKLKGTEFAEHLD